MIYRKLEAKCLSHSYEARLLNEKDVSIVCELMRSNRRYYELCGRCSTAEDVLHDMRICPPNKTLEDKYYAGFFENGMLIAVLDLIDGYPDEKCAYIGFFMVNAAWQGKNVGSLMIEELAQYLMQSGFEKMMLAYDSANEPGKRFWKKNGFIDVRKVQQGEAMLVVAQRSFMEEEA